jgi:hypothetical protein
MGCQKRVTKILAFTRGPSGFRFWVCRSLLFLSSVCRKTTKVAVFFLFRFPHISLSIYVYISIDLSLYLYIYCYIYIYCAVPYGKRTQAIFLNLFTVCSSCKRKFVVPHLLMKKQTEVIRLQTD